MHGSIVASDSKTAGAFRRPCRLASLPTRIASLLQLAPPKEAPGTGHPRPRLLSIPRPTIPFLAALIPFAATAASPAHEAAQVSAASAPGFDFDIPAQPLHQALTAFSRRTRIQVLYEGDIARNGRSAALQGRLPPQTALRMLLTGSGLEAVQTDAGTVTLRPAAHPEAPSQPTTNLDPVLITAALTTGDGNPYRTGYAVRETATATGTLTPLLETPLSLQAVDRPALDDQQAIQIGDAVKNISGVSQGFTFGGFAETFTVRGFDMAYANYRDGFRMPAIRIPLVDAERVEVLKGAAANLYGRIQPGGIINVVPLKPLETPYHALEQRIGSFDLSRLRADSTGPVSAGGALRYRFNLEHLHRNSFRDYGFTDRVFLTPSLTWEPGPASRIDLNFLYSDETTREDHGIVALGQRPASLPISRYLQEPSTDTSSTRLTLATVNFDRQLVADWHVKARFAHHHRQVIDPQTGGSALNEATGDLQRYFYVGRGSGDNLAGTVELAGQFHTGSIPHRLLAGWDYYSQQGTVRGIFRKAGAINIYRPRYGFSGIVPARLSDNIFMVQFDEWQGVFLQDQAELREGIHLLAGGRYDWADHRLGSGETPFAARTTETTARAARFNPRLGLVYQPQHGLSLFANYVESLGSANDGTTLAGKALPPETAEQYEAGLKLELFEGALTSSLALYHLTKHHIARPLAGTPYVQAIGEARSRGVEFDLSGRIVDGLDLIASYAWTDARVADADRRGHRLPNAPEHSASLWLKTGLPAVPGLDLGGGIYWQGPRQGDLENSFRLPGYLRLDGMIKYQLPAEPAVTLQVNVENLLDQRYFVSASGRYGVVPGSPRSIVGSIRLDY